MEKHQQLEDLADQSNNPVENEFLHVVSQELQTLQSVIEEANTRIVKLQSEIATCTGSKAERLCGRSYALTKRLPQHENPDVPPEDAIRNSQDMKNQVASSPPKVALARERTDDPDLADKEDVQAQFERIDTSKNGFLSAQELTAIAITHGHQLTLKGVVNAVKYINSGQTEVPSEDGIHEVGQEECDQEGFIRLRSDEALIDQAPNDIVGTLLALKKALEDESDDHMFETSKAKFNQRQRSALLKEAMDVGIVFVIAVNAAVIGIAIDTPHHMAIWEVVEIVFFSIYLLEFIVKNAWWGIKNYFCGSDFSWNLFDFGCLLVSAVELLLKVLAGDERQGQSQLNLLKVLRLARLFRLVRIMRFKMFKELKLMAMGLLSGIRALAWAIVLLMVVIYTISIVTKSFFGETHAEFRSVGAGMFTLFRCFTEACENYEGDPIPEQLYLEWGFGFQVAYVLVTMLVTVGLFNLILAVFIDNVTKSQNQRKQKELGDSAIETEVKLKMLLARFINEPGPSKASSHMMDRFSEEVTNKLSNLTDVAKKRHQLEQRVCADEAFKLLKEHNINITRAIFQAWLQDGEFVRVLDEADVDISNRFELFNILDVDLGGELSPHELLTGLLSLRGEVTKGDVIYILLRVRDMTHRMEQLQEDVKGLTNRPLGRLT